MKRVILCGDIESTCQIHAYRSNCPLSVDLIPLEVVWIQLFSYTPVHVVLLVWCLCVCTQYYKNCKV